MNVKCFDLVHIRMWSCTRSRIEEHSLLFRLIKCWPDRQPRAVRISLLCEVDPVRNDQFGENLILQSIQSAEMINLLRLLNT